MRKSAVGDNRTESITLRVGKNVLDKLREDVDRTMKTVNILGNQILTGIHEHKNT